MTQDYTVEYDVVLECYTLQYNDEVICLGAETYHQALCEADSIVANS